VSPFRNANFTIRNLTRAAPWITDCSSTLTGRYNNEENHCHSRLLRTECALIAPLAFAQTSSTRARKEPSAIEPITVTGAVITTTTEGGAAASYQPFKTLVVLVDGSNNPRRFVLDGPGHVVNKAGEVVQTAIKTGAHVRVYYVNTGDSRVVDHVVVE
jgi:hypothetical protein